MKIALDYDFTYTLDSEFWNDFIANAKKYGHEVICVTMRYGKEEDVVDMPIRVIYTGRKAKRPFLEAMNIRIDIWIDDSPDWIINDAN